jgi:hypothetical protein
MPENSEPVDHPVLVHFRQKDPKTGKSVNYDPAGSDGWPNAKDVISLVPDSDEAKHLLAGADSHHGPLIGKPKQDEPKPAASRSTTAKSADSKES